MSLTINDPNSLTDYEKNLPMETQISIYENKKSKLKDKLQNYTHEYNIRNNILKDPSNFKDRSKGQHKQIRRSIENLENKIDVIELSIQKINKKIKKLEKKIKKEREIIETSFINSIAPAAAGGNRNKTKKNIKRKRKTKSKKYRKSIKFIKSN